MMYSYFKYRYICQNYELYDGGCDHIEEFLYADILLWRILWFDSS